MRGEEDGPALPLEVSNQSPEFPPGARIQARRRLIEEEELWLADQCHRDAEAPLLTTGKVQCERTRAVRQPDRLDDVRHIGLRNRVVEEMRPVCHSLAGTQAVERLEILGQDPDPLADATIPGADVFSEDAGLSRGRVAEALQDLDGGRLTRAVRAEQGEHLPSVDVEVDAVDGRDVRIPLHEAADLDHVLAHARLPRGTDIARCHGVFGLLVRAKPSR